MPLTKEQFQKARNSGYSVEQIAGFEKRRESEPQAKKPFSFRAEIAAPIAHGASALAFDIPRTAMEIQVKRGTPGAKQAYDYLYPEQTTKIGKALRFGSEAAGTVGGGAGKIASSIFRGAGKKLGIEATKQAVKEGAKLSFKQGAKQLGKKVIQGAASGVAFTGATAQPTREEYIEGLKSGAVYGAALPIAGEVAGKTGKAIRSLVKSKEDKIFNVYNKAFGVKEKTIRNLKKVKQSRVNAVKAIQEHLPDTPLQNNLTGETFGPVPTNRYEMIVSLESAKKNIWKKATELSQGATEKGAKIDLKSSVRDAYKKTLKDWGDVAVKTTKKGDIAKIKELADTIAVEGKISPFKSQDFMKSLFNDVKALSERGTPLDYSKKDFLYNLQANLNTSTDEVIELYLGKAGYKNLRSQYASLKGIEKEILAGANKYVKTQGGQSGGIRPIVNLWSLEEVASGMLTGNIQRVEQGIILKIASKVLDYFRSPDRNIKKMFKFASELPTAKPRFKPEILTDIQTSGQKLLRGRQPQARLPFETRRLPSPRNVPFNPPGTAPRPRPFAPPNVQGQGVIAGQAPYTGTTLPAVVRAPRQKLSFTKRSKQAKAKSKGQILRSAGSEKVFPREIIER